MAFSSVISNINRFFACMYNDFENKNISIYKKQEGHMTYITRRIPGQQRI